MSTIYSLCKYIRSKNAGPFWITLDIFCEKKENYCKIKSSDKFNPEVIGKIYHTDSSKVKIFFVDSLHVIKVSIPRKFPQGDVYERDMHGGQQYIELGLLDI